MNDATYAFGMQLANDSVEISGRALATYHATHASDRNRVRSLAEAHKWLNAARTNVALAERHVDRATLRPLTLQRKTRS